MAVGSLFHEPPQCSDKAQGLAIARLGHTFPLILLLIKYPYGLSHFWWPCLMVMSTPIRRELHCSGKQASNNSRSSHAWQSISIDGRVEAGLFAYEQCVQAQLVCPSLHSRSGIHECQGQGQNTGFGADSSSRTLTWVCGDLVKFGTRPPTSPALPPSTAQPPSTGSPRWPWKCVDTWSFGVHVGPPPTLWRG